MKKANLFGVLVAALVLCASLVGCGGNGAEKAAENFVGTWGLESIEKDGKQVGGDELAMAQAMGVYLVINEDGTASVELYGIEVTGTWTAKDANTISLKTNADETAVAEEADLSEDQDVVFADGKVSLTTDDEKLLMKKIDPSEKKSADLGSLLDSVGDDAAELTEEEDGSDDVLASLDEVTELDVTVADDDVCAIKVTAMGDYYGDPGYLVSVTNKTEEQIGVDDSDGFTVSGAEVSPIFSMIVDPGKTKREILWFSESELEEAGVDGVSDVSGKLVVSNYESGKELGTYDFKL